MTYYPHTLYIKFFTPETFFARMVAFLARGKYCHVGVTFYEACGWNYADMWSTGMRIIPSSGPGSDTKIEIPTHGILLLPWLQARHETPYGWFDLFVIGARKWLGVLLGGDPKGMVCSEMVATLLDENGLFNIPRRQITPDELLALLRQPEPGVEAQP